MRIVLLSGGVGGARMATGLAAELGPDLTVVVNVGDDDEVYGLYVSPDLDTVIYTLAGIQGPHGWGRDAETWSTMEQLARFPIDTGFRIGDRDLATNLFRTARLREGVGLSAITEMVGGALGAGCRVLPASDDRVRTRVRLQQTREWLDFQTYFVRRGHQDRIDAVSYAGSGDAHPAPGVIEAIERADAIVIGPSNPPLSILPILAVPDICKSVATAGRVACVSPLIGGQALKGPAADVLRALGHPPGNRGVVAAYEGLVTHLVVDGADSGDRDELAGVEVLVTDTRIPDRSASIRLAREVLAWLA